MPSWGSGATRVSKLGSIKSYLKSLNALSRRSQLNVSVLIKHVEQRYREATSQSAKSHGKKKLNARRIDFVDNSYPLLRNYVHDKQPEHVDMVTRLYKMIAREEYEKEFQAWELEYMHGYSLLYIFVKFAFRYTYVLNLRKRVSKKSKGEALDTGDRNTEAFKIACHSIAKKYADPDAWMSTYVVVDGVSDKANPIKAFKLPLHVLYPLMKYNRILSLMKLSNRSRRTRRVVQPELIVGLATTDLIDADLKRFVELNVPGVESKNVSCNAFRSALVTGSLAINKLREGTNAIGSSTAMSSHYLVLTKGASEADAARRDAITDEIGEYYDNLFEQSRGAEEEQVEPGKGKSPAGGDDVEDPGLSGDSAHTTTTSTTSTAPSPPKRKPMKKKRSSKSRQSHSRGSSTSATSPPATLLLVPNYAEEKAASLVAERHPSAGAATSPTAPPAAKSATPTPSIVRPKPLSSAFSTPPLRRSPRRPRKGSATGESASPQKRKDAQAGVPRTDETSSANSSRKRPHDGKTSAPSPKRTRLNNKSYNAGSTPHKASSSTSGSDSSSSASSSPPTSGSVFEADSSSSASPEL